MRKSEAPKLLELEALAELTLVDRIAEAFDDVVDICEQVYATGLLYCIGLDPYGVKDIVDALAARGMTQDGGEVLGVSQGYQLNGVIKTVEGRLADARLAHGGQPLMAWAVGNARIKVVGSNVMITKQASGTAKIDPLMALFDAASLMLRSAASGAPVYTADRGLAVFG